MFSVFVDSKSPVFVWPLSCVFQVQIAIAIIYSYHSYHRNLFRFESVTRNFFVVVVLTDQGMMDASRHDKAILQIATLDTVKIDDFHFMASNIFLWKSV